VFRVLILAKAKDPWRENNCNPNKLIKTKHTTVEAWPASCLRAASQSAACSIRALCPAVSALFPQTSQTHVWIQLISSTPGRPKRKTGEKVIRSQQGMHQIACRGRVRAWSARERGRSEQKQALAIAVAGTRDALAKSSTPRSCDRNPETRGLASEKKMRKSTSPATKCALPSRTALLDD
jgi:hypothetical protein